MKKISTKWSLYSNYYVGEVPTYLAIPSTYGM